jgi:hypothetical protein
MPLTWEEAKDLLEEYRSYLIARGRYEAVKIALRDGTVHSRQVRAVMDAAGLLHSDLDERWMGVVFSYPEYFEYTGERVEVEEASPRSRGGGGGGRPVRLWRLKPGVRLPSVPYNVSKPGLLSEALGPSRPTKHVIAMALDDIRSMQAIAKEHGFKHKHHAESVQLAKYMRYLAEEDLP